MDNANMAALANGMNEAACNAGPAYSQQPISLETIAGAKVKRIVIAHIDPSKTRFGQSKSKTPWNEFGLEHFRLVRAISCGLKLRSGHCRQIWSLKTGVSVFFSRMVTTLPFGIATATTGSCDSCRLRNEAY